MAAHGLGASALGSVAAGDRAPEWLLKWTALICEYLELEEACLKKELLDQPRSLYTEATAAAEAKGVIANRLQNIVITLDKVKMVLAHPAQSRDPPLTLLTDQEVLDHLWVGHKSVAKKLLRSVASHLAPTTQTRAIVGSRNEGELEAAVAAVRGQVSPELGRVCDAALAEAHSVEVGFLFECL
jgi:hypothetical protein